MGGFFLRKPEMPLKRFYNRAAFFLGVLCKLNWEENQIFAVFPQPFSPAM